MTREIIYDQDALADLDAIWYYIAIDQHNPPAADKQIRKIVAICELLATQPHMGRARDDLAAGLRYSP